MNIASVITVAFLLAGLLPAGPAVAGEVHIVVNGLTGDVVVAGNAPDSSEWVRRNTVARVPDGWERIVPDEHLGWGAVSCVRHENGQWNFRMSNGDKSEADARRYALGASEKHISRTEIPGKVVPECGVVWNDTNQPIAVTNKLPIVAKATAAPASSPSTRGKSGSGKLSATPIGALANPILINRDTVLVPQSQPGVPSRFSTGGEPNGTPGSAPAGYQAGRMTSVAPPTPEQAAPAAQARLRCRLPSDELDPNPYPVCEKNADSSVPGGTRTHNDGQAPTTRGAPAPGMELHLEAVTVCEYVQPWSKTGQWRCQGPVGFAYVNFDKANWLVQLKAAGGSKFGQPPRDLGLVGRFRAFGWEYPLTAHPDRNNDTALKMGVPTIPTRLRYWCPKGTSTGCTLQ